MPMHDHDPRALTTPPPPSSLATVTSQLAELRDHLAALTAAVSSLQAEVTRGLQELALMRASLEQPSRPSMGQGSGSEWGREQLVTLDQMAAMVHRKKLTLAEYRDVMPRPRIKARRRGQASLYEWTEVRPWLEATFGRRLPEDFPGLIGP